MNLNEQIRERVVEVLSDTWVKTDVGGLQSEAALTSLQNGNLLIVLRKPGGAPITRSVRRRRLKG